MSLCAPNSPSALSLDDLESNLIALFNPPDTLVKSLAEFQEVKQKSESYNQYFKDLNRLVELCRFRHRKSEFLKYKLFLAACSEIFFAIKLADLDYEHSTPKDLLTQLQTLEVAFKDSSTVRSVHNMFK